MRVLCTTIIVLIVASTALGQKYGPPDRGMPGDEMIQKYLARETQKIHDKFMQDIESAEDWEKLRPRYKEEYLHMLGLWPMPAETPLEATVTIRAGRDCM
jgi:hypothetical protein